VSPQELGTRVHRCLETADWDALRLLESEVGPARLDAGSVVRWAQSSPWMGSGPGVWTELEFEVPVEGEILVGSIDRLIAKGDAQGKKASTDYQIIDFKVSGGERSAASLLEAYQTQLDLYAYAVRALDPKAGEIAAMLVHIGGGQVQTVPSEVRPEASLRLARAASEIVAGQPGIPNPGTICRHCDFRGICDARQT
jgi:CRISPR/Cas system-associated exonuclease Cas4 (RecB family)